MHAETLENAIRKAHAIAQPGDVVLLAPACASFDQFKSYEHRGKVFKEIVRDFRQSRLWWRCSIAREPKQATTQNSTINNLLACTPW